ncbi:F/Y-rich domain-containing protein [Encephalitozoon hellem]|uniref:F/Y-rich domain-containing protein n=1 Tax=Encephalitozoon hellem TaxID=27973 RepID=A0ABY8CRQ3_ENCHE|nr:F/Y-rich domain-containing protein [Encephalitozoon hellem]
MNCEESGKECSLQQKRLMSALKRRDLLREEMEKTGQALRRLEAHRRALVDVLRIYDGRMEIDAGRYRPAYRVDLRDSKGLIHVPGERHHLVIYSLGRIPTPSMKPFYSQKNVYPVDYMCKRAYYRGGGGFPTGKDMALYTCTVRNVCSKPLFEITEGDLCIRGKAGEVFNAFRSLFPEGIEFTSIVEFFGLNNMHVRKLISEQEGFAELGIGDKWERRPSVG